MRIRESRLEFSLHLVTPNYLNTMHKYQRVAGEELGDGADAEHSLSQDHSWRKTTHISRVTGWIFQVVFFLISCAILLSGLRLRYKPSQTCHNWDYEPQWSPLLKAVEGTGHLHRFDGSFATPNEYKGTPNPLIDGAWDRVLMANGM